MIFNFDQYLVESKRGDITFAEAARISLVANNNTPMSAKEIWKYISDNNIASSSGSTPWLTLNTVMSRFSRNTKIDLSKQNRNPNKIEIFEITSNSPMKFKLINTNSVDKEEVSNDKENLVDNYQYIENPFKQAICVLGPPGVGKSVTIRKMLRNEDHIFIQWEPTGATTNLLGQFSPNKGHIPSKLGNLLIQASQNPTELYTAVIEEFHKSHIIELVNDELKHAISLKRFEGDRFIPLEDYSNYLTEYLEEDDAGNLRVPDNFGWIFISSKPRVIANNGDIFDRLDFVMLKHHEEDPIDSVEELLERVLSKEEKAKLASTRND